MKAAAQLSSCIKFNPFSGKWILLYEMAAEQFGALAEKPRLEGPAITLAPSSRTALMMATSAAGWQRSHPIHLYFMKHQQASYPGKAAEERYTRYIKGLFVDFFFLLMYYFFNCCTPLEWVITLFFSFLMPFHFLVFFSIIIDSFFP